MSDLTRLLGKAVALPFRVVDLPFKAIRKLVDNDDTGVFEAVADAVEESIEEIDK